MQTFPSRAIGAGAGGGGICGRFNFPPYFLPSVPMSESYNRLWGTVPSFNPQLHKREVVTITNRIVSILFYFNPYPLERELQLRQLAPTLRMFQSSTPDAGVVTILSLGLMLVSILNPQQGSL